MATETTRPDTTTPAPGEARREGRVGRYELARAEVKDGVLFDVRDLEVFFPIHETFFKSMVSREKRYVKAVDRISFQVKQGEILALVGESGCGKTTTGRTMLRLEEATGGDIFYKGLPMRSFTGRPSATTMPRMLSTEASAM